MVLKEKIAELIKLKKEGKTWDFKGNWYTSKALLLHDILNMANNETYEDSFIIIGVDENNDFSLVDIKNDSNRYNQNDLNNFLYGSKVKFAGNNVPTIKLETIEIDNCNIDVIIIKSTNKVPYYLIEDYIEKLSSTNGKKSEIIVHSSNIYIRRNNSNTAINKCASDIEIEQLWRKRLGIDLSVHEKFFKILSNKEEWESYNDIYFHKFCPDFTFKMLEENCNSQYHRPIYSYRQYDKRQHTYILEIFFRNIKIDEYRVDLLDGGRMTLVYPNIEYISKLESCRETYTYLYFVKNDIRNKLNNIFIDLEENSEHRYIHSIVEEYVIFFENDIEKIKFDEHLKSNLEDLIEKSKKIIDDYSDIEVEKDTIKEKVIEEICLQKTIVEAYNEFRANDMLK